MHSRRLRPCLLPVCLLIGSSLAGCDLALVGRDWDRYPSQVELLAVQRPSNPAVAAQQRGHAVYEHYCQICHGTDGKGTGFNAAMLDPSPRNFTDPEFWQKTTSEQAVAAISGGGGAVGKSTLMPAWGKTLSEKQIQDVVAFLQTFPNQAEAQSE